MPSKERRMQLFSNALNKIEDATKAADKLRGLSKHLDEEVGEQVEILDGVYATIYDLS